MADFLLGFAPTQNLTLTITSLANGSSRASTVVTNSSGYADALVSFRIKTASASVDTRGSVGIFAYASTNNGGYYTEGATGTDGAITLTSPTNAAKVGYANANVASTTYDIGPFSVASVFFPYKCEWSYCFYPLIFLVVFHFKKFRVGFFFFQLFLRKLLRCVLHNF